MFRVITHHLLHDEFQIITYQKTLLFCNLFIRVVIKAVIITDLRSELLRF